jgi:hypothetical protein
LSHKRENLPAIGEEKSEDDTEDDDIIKSNLGIARSKAETAEEKKARKNALKEIRRVRPATSDYILELKYIHLESNTGEERTPISSDNSWTT